MIKVLCAVVSLFPAELQNLPETVLYSKEGAGFMRDAVKILIINSDLKPPKDFLFPKITDKGIIGVSFCALGATKSGYPNGFSHNVTGEQIGFINATSKAGEYNVRQEFAFAIRGPINPCPTFGTLDQSGAFPVVSKLDLPFTTALTVAPIPFIYKPRSYDHEWPVCGLHGFSGNFVCLLGRFNGGVGYFDLSLTNASGCFGHFLGFMQRQVNQDDRPSAQKNSDHGGEPHDFSKESHGLLSIKVLLGAFMVVGGFYLLLNTIPKGYTIQRETFLINTIFGILYMVVGSLFAAYAMFG